VGVRASTPPSVRSRDAKDEEVSGERTDEQTADDGEGGTEGGPRAERTPLQQHRSD